jgi:hypothetical protein
LSGKLWLKISYLVYCSLDMTIPRYKTAVWAKARLLERNSERFKSIAGTLSDRYGFDLQPQVDLLYLESCLVTAGAKEGINDNDDIFTVEEAWAARNSPILKPFNWQHQEKDIVGVMYSVQARDLDGNVLDISSDTPPTEPFDLWTEAVLFRLVHPQIASEVEKRAKSDSLYVSMEAWFDDYNYGLCDKNGIVKTVARNKSTSFLDSHLRANGGVGTYVDPETAQEMRIGRVLRAITFGGCGLVDRPANKRSVIETAVPMLEMTRSGDLRSDDQVKLLLQQVLESVESSREEILMNANAQMKDGIGPEDIKATIGGVLDEREARAKAEADLNNLKARATAAEKEAADLAKQVEELTQAKQEKDTETQSLRDELDRYNEVVDKLVQTEAGASGNTPAEIAAIDAAKSGEAAFTAKLAWLEKSRASLKARAERADELEGQLAEAEAVVREQEVRTLLGDVVSDEALEAFVARAANMDDEAYAEWRDEKELMVIELSAHSAENPFAKKGEEKKKMDKKSMDKSGDKGCANLFESLLRQRRAESGTASPETMPEYVSHLINPQGGANLKSGVTPGAPGLSTPRHKIAGSAQNSVASLEHAHAEASLNLAGASTGEDGEIVSPFRSLAAAVAGSGKKLKDPAEKPGFDPVQ